MADTKQKLSFAQRKEQRARLIEQCAQSGLSKKEFCLQNNINYMTFLGWMSRKRAGKKREQKAAPSTFIPIEAVHPSTGIFAEVHLENTRRIVFYQPVSVEYLQHLTK